ncbi:hypothetical protein HEQ75_21265 [Roseomonas sp. BU-1]|uniref:Uncharacterized protein n=1 Tax=Falsiroseomonas selenitidurans TaxID=2716335 RepID=A0ABX1E9F1_9PROT|nr:hypothetical protein [Falsiroseomonas selenitidurans]
MTGEAEAYFWRGRFARRRWVCTCDCGGITEIREDRLRLASTISCGCARDEAARERLFRHGARAGGRCRPEYGAWQAMLHRADGAPVARRWQDAEGDGFKAFLRDLGPRPSAVHALARLDPARPFEPRNCAWLPISVRRGQPRRLLELDGRLVSLKAAAQAYGVSYALLCKRLERGWPLVEALGRVARGGSALRAVAAPPAGHGVSVAPPRHSG